VRIGRRTWIAAGLIAGICFLLGLLGSSQMPKVRALIAVKIEKATRENLPVRILPGAVDISLFPLGATFSNVNVVAKPEVAKYLESAWFRNVRVVISPWQLLRGKLRLTSLEIHGARIRAAIPPSPKKKNSAVPLDGLFNVIQQIPINLIALDDVGADLTLSDPNLKLEIDGVDLVAEKRKGNSIKLELASAGLHIVSGEKGSGGALKIDVETSALLSRSSLEVENLAVRRGDSYFSASGEARGNVEALDFRDLSVALKSELNLESLGAWAAKTFPEEMGKLPKLKGRGFIEATVLREGGKGPTAEVDARAEGLKIAKFLGDKFKTRAKVSVKDKVPHIAIANFSIDNPAGGIDLDNIDIVLNENKTATAFLGTKNLQLHELLRSLGAGEIPVYLQISGGLPCQMAVKPDFKLSCKGRLSGENLLVRDSMKSKGSIVALRGFAAEGEVVVDKDKVSYTTELAMPNSRGRSDGVIKYDEGFKINYEGDKVSFKDAANLADLKIEGSAHMAGSTEGDSDAATFSMAIDGTDLWLEDFWLGNAKGQMSYKSGILSFANMQGYYTTSRYNGEVKLDVIKNEIAITGRSPFYDVRDLLKVFSRKVKLPFAVTGTGQAQVKASGPLALNKLTYDLRTTAFRGSVAGESFDQANFDVKSNAGEVTAERVQVAKGNALITLTGVGHPDGNIKTLVQGRGLKLEDSTVISNSGLALSGQVDFDMDLTGYVLGPDTDFRCRVTRTAVGDQSVPDSSFHMIFGSKTVSGDGEFLGGAVKSKFIVPLAANAPYLLKMTMSDWNYVPLFAAIAGPNGRKEYEGHLTANVDLAGNDGGFWNSTGQINIDKFTLARNQLVLKATNPATVRVKNGQFRLDAWDLASENGSYLKIAENPKPVTKLDLQANGKLDMALFGLFTPFLEDLRGLISFTFNLRGGPGQADLLGSAYLEKGYVKLFDFAHPFEDIRIDLLFNQKKILLNTVKSDFGGGRITASGGIELKGYKDYPVNISGQFEKVSLNVPDKVRTSGSGTASFTGNWFPFTLKIDYEVKDGLWSKEFGGADAADADAIRREQYLPELLQQERFVPVLMDLAVNFNKGVQVKNELFDGRATGSVTVKGPPSKPSILGTINLEKESKIIVKDTEFQVQTGNVQLDDPNQVNPKLYITARARVQEYDVTVLAQGTGSKPDLSFTSVPPLSNRDIISLLALGTTEATGGRSTPVATSTGGNQNQSSPNAPIAAPVFKNNPVAREFKDKTGIDVQFAPSFDEQSAVQKIIIKRQFTNKFGVSASQAYGNKRTSEAEARYRLNDRVSGVLSWQNTDQIDTKEKTGIQKEQNQFGLDLEYKFEFK